MMIRAIYIVFVLLFVSSCEVPVENQFGNAVPVQLVIDAIVTNQPGESYVKLSMPLAGPNDQVVMVSGATVFVSDGANTVKLEEDTVETGTYRPDRNLRGTIRKNYKIVVQVGDFKDSAVTYLIPVSPLSEFKVHADQSRPGYFFISGDNSNGQAIVQYIINPPGCTGEPGCKSVIYEYKLSTFDVAQIFSPKKESLSFPADSKVIRKKYSLNPEYESYIRSLLSETEWRGGLFDVQPGNLQGNFGKYTLGYFAGCSLVTDTVYIP